MGRFRHYRKNPTISDPTARGRITFSVVQARRFLIEAEFTDDLLTHLHRHRLPMSHSIDDCFEEYNFIEIVQ